MKLENHYCCQCHRTTKYEVTETTFKCTGCGVVVEKAGPAEARTAPANAPEPRTLIGNPFRSYKTRFAA